LDAVALEAAFGFSRFDLALGRDLLDPRDAALTPTKMLEILARALPGTVLALSQILPREGGRISRLFMKTLGPELAARLGEFEDGFYARQDLPTLGPGRAEFEAMLGESGFICEIEARRDSYPRRLSGPEIESWLSPASAYGSALAQCFPVSDISRIGSALASEGALVDWPISVLYVKLRFPS
jgi:hypothetical protein